MPIFKQKNSVSICKSMEFCINAQKYLVLKERKGLITHGMNGWSRNMNYFGEMMLYASFVVLVPRWEVALIYSYMWGVVFYLKMAIKDY